MYVTKQYKYNIVEIQSLLLKNLAKYNITQQLHVQNHLHIRRLYTSTIN
jgi:hypothetical protein